LRANRWILLAAIPLFLALIAESYLSVRFAMDEREQQGWVVHTYKVVDRLQDILNDAQAAETGQRGYIITRQENFLAPYHDGMGKAHRDLEEFRTLTVDNPSQQKRAELLSSLMADRFRALDTTLATSRPPVSRDVLAAMDQGKAKMDALRIELARGMAEENLLLRQRADERRHIERNEIVATSLAALVALFVILGAALLLVRSNRSLSDSERKLANESAILQTTLDTIRDGIAMFASEGQLCVSNDNFFRLAGFPAELARRSATLSDFEALERTREARILEAAPGRDYRTVALGGRQLEVYHASVPTGGFIVVCADVTARLTAEQTARQAQKMEAIGHLTGGVAHDFNNLLQIVGANLERAAADLKGDPATLDRVQNSLEAARRGARLTSQLLAFARRQALDPRSTNVGRVIQDMTDLLRRTIGERIDIESIVAGGLWNTFIDPGQLEGALLNLAINARDAMPDGGKLTVEVANAYLDDAYAAQHSEVVSGQYVMVGVSDTGDGMNPDVIARAFEPFFTTKPEGRGTGLGLSQVYGFVKQSGGHIKIYSELGQGTTVKLYLPRTRKPEEGTGPVSTGPIEGGNERILVVEDEAAVRAAAVESLTDLGYQVLKAENGEQALAILSSGVVVDVLFTDVIMPGPIGARELSRRAQELQPKILVLYTSGYTQNAIVHNGKLDADALLLSKPYRREDLARKLRAMLAGRPKREQAQAKAKAKAPQKVLIVEDVALIRMTTVDMVEQLGFIVSEAGDGNEAMAALQGDPDIAIMLTDLGLPGMSGRDLVAQASALRPELKIIIVSGYSSESDGGELARFAHLMKPFDIEQLRRVLGA
jgi:signal transduction histidine kinase/DNA-binding response OmpR family regulator/CHASE3 domain sensor protein